MIKESRLLLFKKWNWYYVVRKCMLCSVVYVINLYIDFKWELLLIFVEISVNILCVNFIWINLFIFNVYIDVCV